MYGKKKKKEDLNKIQKVRLVKISILLGDDACYEILDQMEEIL